MCRLHIHDIHQRCVQCQLTAALHRNLAIPERAWPGLKQLPEMAGLSVDSQQNYISMVKLDCNLNNIASHSCQRPLCCNAASIPTEDGS